MLTNFVFDLKYALRLWAKSPGYFVVCAAVVGLSVGLALWASILVYTLTMKPLPFPGSERWLSIQIAKNATSDARPQLDPYTYQEILKRSPDAEHLGAYVASSVTLSDGHASSRLRAAAISPRLLSATGAVPLQGRLFEANEGQRDSTPIAILSYSSWRDHFAGDPSIVGKAVRIDGKSVQVVGIMAESFFAFDDFEVWTPLQLEVLSAADAGAEPLAAFVAIKQGQEAQALQRDMAAAVEEVNRNYGKLFDEARRLELVPAHQMFTHGFTAVQTMISLIAVAVLLLGCVNISLVLFARLLERSRELALRVALGSTRARMLRQCLLESVLVMLPGLLLGVVLTVLGVRWTRHISDTMTQYLANGRDGNPLLVRPGDLLVAVIIAAVLWLLSTLLPSWRLSRQDPSVALGGSGKGVARAGSARFASVIVGFQVLVSAVVLVVCMNLMAAVHEETTRPTGLDASSLLLSTYPTEFGERYADASSRNQQLNKLSNELQRRMAGSKVAFATAVPTRAGAQPVAIEGQVRSTDQAALKLPLVAVSEEYFSLLGIGLKTGRLFSSADSETALPVALVDEVTAKRYWPGQEPVGKRIQLDPAGGGAWMTVVGVVAAVGHEPYSDQPGVIYRPWLQSNPDRYFTLVKAPVGAAEARAALSDAAYAADQDLPLHNVQYLTDYLGALDITYTALVPAFGVIAGVTLMLAASGLFGLISRFVASRTQEIGIRLALGSSPKRVTWLFMRQGLSYLTVGVVGGGLGLLIANVLSGALPNILSHALPVTAGVFLVLALVIFTASYLPARRALAMDVADALRHE